MVDSWTVTEANKSSITISMSIADTSYERVVSISSLDGSTLGKLRDSLRSYLVAFRNEVLISETPSAVVRSAVGYTEDF